MSYESDKTNFKQQFKKRCFHFSISILNLTEKLTSKRINGVLINQLIRSATSIGANVVEGSYSSSKKEFINYFQISVKSAAETAYWLSLLEEINPLQKEEVDKLIQECSELRKILSTVVLNTKNHSKF